MYLYHHLQLLRVSFIMATLFSISQVTVILTSVVIRAAIVVLVCALTSLSGRLFEVYCW